MRSLAITILGATALISSPVSAQTFTFDAVANAPVNVGTVGPDGVPVAGSYWTGTTQTAWADGKKTSETYTCISTTQPPNNAIFHMHAICDAESSAGNYTSVWGCNFQNKERTMIGCVGGLYGKTGMYAKKGGGITYAGKMGTGSGTGQWRN